MLATEVSTIDGVSSVVLFERSPLLSFFPSSLSTLAWSAFVAGVTLDLLLATVGAGVVGPLTRVGVCCAW